MRQKKNSQSINTNNQGSNMSNRRCVAPSESSTIDAHDGDGRRLKVGGIKWKWETGRRKRKRQTRNARGNASTPHPQTTTTTTTPAQLGSLSRRPVTRDLARNTSSLSPPNRKIGHILFNTATAWHSFTVEHNIHYSTWSFKESNSACRDCNRKSLVTLFVYSDVAATYGLWICCSVFNPVTVF